jgi:hypothetical protein
MKAFAGKTQHYQEGMDLRDYFAAEAMKGLIVKSLNDPSLTQDRIIKEAYSMAGKMMIERETK